MPKRAPHVQVLSHGFCFDGWVSAALFTRLRERLGSCAGFDYRSLGYGPKLGELPRAWLSGDENALLDFRFSESPRVGWYFDHHATAFRDPEQRREAEERAARAGRRLFYDPAAPSCAHVIARTARERFRLDLDELTPLLEWADKVDAARFDSAEEAFYAEAPALRLAEVAERHGDSDFLRSFTRPLLERGLELARDPELAARARAIDANKTGYLAAVRAHGREQGEIVRLDLLDAPSLVVAGKFATYVAFPRARYSIALLPTRDQLKLGVGHNPFSGLPRGHDIGALCQKHGGGGHPAVGAVAFARGETARAREVADALALALSR